MCRVIPGLQPIPSSPRRRAPSSVSRLENRYSSPLGRRGVDDAPALEDEPHARDLEPLADGRELGELDDVLGGVSRPARRRTRRPACWSRRRRRRPCGRPARASGRCRRRRSAARRPRRGGPRSGASSPSAPSSRRARRRRGRPRTAAEREARVLGQRVGRVLAGDPRDLVRHRAAHEVRRSPSPRARAARRQLDQSRVFSGASIVTRASIRSLAKRSISGSSPSSSAGASEAQARSIGQSVEAEPNDRVGAPPRRSARTSSSSSGREAGCVADQDLPARLDVEAVLDEQSCVRLEPRLQPRTASLAARLICYKEA